MSQRRQPPVAYLFAEAAAALQHAKRVHSFSTQENCREALNNIAKALSEYTAEGELKPYSGSSLNLVPLSKECCSTSTCSCYSCTTIKLEQRLTTKGYTRRYVDKHLSFWRGLVKLAIEQGRLPAFFMPAMRYSRKLLDITAFSNDEVRMFLERAEDPRTRLAFYIAVHSGLRRQEILHLRYQDITSFDDGFDIEVQAKRCNGHPACRKQKVPNSHRSTVSKESGKDEWGWWFPKTRENRVAGCSLGLEKMLKASKAFSRNSTWLFPGWDGEQPLSIFMFSQMMRKGLQQAGLYKARNGRWGFHTCRRTFITRHIQHTEAPEVALMAGCSVSNLENYVAPNRARHRKLVAEMAKRTQA